MHHVPDSKAKVALEALKGEQTAAGLASRFALCPTMIHGEERALLEGAAGVVGRGGAKEAGIDEEPMKA